MAKYKILSIDKFELTDVRGDPDKALKLLGGEEGIRKMVESIVNGENNA